VDRPGDILQRLLARVLDVERHLIARVIEDCPRDTYAAGFGDRLKSRRNVNAVSKDVMGLDDYVADIDAHTESNAPVFRITDCKFMNAGLELHRSSNRLDSARKLRQEPVAGILHDAAAVLRNHGLDTAREERGQFGVRSLFVTVHQPRIASHVSGHYCRQPAFDPAWLVWHHGTQTFVPHFVRQIRLLRQPVVAALWEGQNTD
jgi:hypothetical protein